ncbi:MAG: sigma-70 family RNA polymerase sigma factor [Bacteroidales bacterium]|nr:sigma-70 family RNA polymerase sigma factor [Bacteroidales bacterium]
MTEHTERYTDFDKLMLRHKTLIRRLCWWHSGGESALCADLMQEVAIDLWHYRHTLRPDATEQQERLWVKYHCRSVFSHRRRRKTIDTESLAEKHDIAEPAEDLRETIEELATDLNPHERKMLDLLLNGYSIAEIAAQLQIKATSASQLRFRVIEKMKQAYNTIQQ